MGLKSITDKVFYSPHQPETDRPMLAYLKGDKLALAIDAGSSAAHVDEFYGALEAEGLHRPDFTAITHWHWDHTFGMHRISGVPVCTHYQHQKADNTLFQRGSRNVPPFEAELFQEKGRKRWQLSTIARYTWGSTLVSRAGFYCREDDGGRDK